MLIQEITIDPINESISAELADPETGRLMEIKSCPSCSRKADKSIFFPLEYFGERTFKDGRTIIQSWCPPCRHYKDSLYELTRD